MKDILTILTAVPGLPNVNVDSTTTTSISLSWSVPNGSEVDSYEVMWTSDECPDDVDEGNATITEISYIIGDLREGTSYAITVSATNSAGTSPSDSVTGETEELGNSVKMCVILLKILCPLNISLPAPSAAPTSGSVSAVTSSSITVQWEAVDCIHRNGDITGYSVRYGVVGSGSTQTVNVSGASVTISNLMSSTNYSIQVAAENSAGRGVYSDAITVDTVGEEVFAK